jgi:hypothetical protein
LNFNLPTLACDRDEGFRPALPHTKALHDDLERGDVLGYRCRDATEHVAHVGAAIGARRPPGDLAPQDSERQLVAQ